MCSREKWENLLRKWKAEDEVEKAKLREQCKRKKKKRKHGQCEVFRCRKRARYGEGEEALRCGSHADSKTMKVLVWLCTYPYSCTALAHFGYPDGDPERCGKHKKKRMVDKRETNVSDEEKSEEK